MKIYIKKADLLQVCLFYLMMTKNIFTGFIIVGGLNEYKFSINK